MKTSLLLLGFMLCFAAPWSAWGDSPPPVRHVLVFTKSAGFEHSVVKQDSGKPNYLETVLAPLAKEHFIEFTFSKDGSVFTAEGMAKYDAFVFYTTGDLTQPGNDKTPPMPPGGKEALLQAIKDGKGFVGLHCASDTFHSPGGAYNTKREDIDPFIAMLGGEFITHNAQQKSRVTCVDPAFPGLADAKGGMELVEEWYSLKNFAPDIHVLMVQQTAGMNGLAYQRPAYPMTWAHLYGKGRVYYTSLAHREDTWSSPAFQKIFFGGLGWATGASEAMDLKPNLAEICPEAAKMPPEK